MVVVTRAISITNFLVATSALAFQTMVLYPWHKELDNNFEELKKEHLKVLEAVKSGNMSKSEQQGLKDRIEELGSKKSSFGLVPHHAAHPSSSTSPSSAADATSSSSAAAAAAVAEAQEPWVHAPKPVYGAALYARYALAGAFVCSFTHAVLTPVDVVKTRIQLDPARYSKNISTSARLIASTEGAGALLTGLGPTVAGYALQGSFKFGGYEYFKQLSVSQLGRETASQNRNTVYLASSAAAEFLGDLALCPFEAVRIRLVSQPEYARGLADGMVKMARQEGVSGLYSGLSPILLKQVPYTMATFVVYEKAISVAYGHLVDKATCSPLAQTGINMTSGLIAGLAAAFVSQPADTILSKINKDKALPGEGTAGRLARIARELGVRGSYAGIRARLVMVGGMTAVQFAIYGDIKKAFGATNGVEI